MSIDIREVKNKKELRSFIHLPAGIHKDHQNWLPPIYLDEWKYFNPKKNASFEHCDTVLLLARDKNCIIGRIMGIIHNQYNEINSEKTARFAYLECYDDPAISTALLDYIGNWAAGKGMKKIIGPYGFSDKDPQGLMIEGFEYPPVLAAPCNLPFLVKHIEDNGFTKELDCLMFLLDLEKPLNGLYERIYEKVSANMTYKVLEFTRKKDLKPYIIPVLQMVNKSYEHLFGFVPLSEKEMKEFAKRYMAVLDPRFIKTVICEGEVVAFILGLPNMTKGIQKSKGHLFPWNLFQIWWAARVTKKLDLMLGGVRPDYQGKGLEVLMGFKLIQSAKDADYQMFEIHLVLETNAPMIAQMKKAGAEPHKRFRVFQKSLV